MERGPGKGKQNSGGGSLLFIEQDQDRGSLSNGRKSGFRSLKVG